MTGQREHEDPTWTDEEVARALASEVTRQDKVYGAFGSDAAQVRLAVACLEDEVEEVHEAWHRGKRRPDWFAVRSEALQVAALALRLVRDLRVPEVD